MSVNKNKHKLTVSKLERRITKLGSQKIALAAEVITLREIEIMSKDAFHKIMSAMGINDDINIMKDAENVGKTPIDYVVDMVIEKIIQVLIGPDCSVYQGDIFGLSSEGNLFLWKTGGWKLVLNNKLFVGEKS